MMSKSLNGLEIAVIGLAGRFPGASSIEEFWNHLVEGKESVTFFTDDELAESGIEFDMRSHPNYVKAKGYVEGCEQFDAAFFGYSPREAEAMDPQTRVFHECVWEALEDAGYSTDTYPGLIGLYAGASNSLHWQAMAHLSSNSEMIGHFTAGQLANRDFMPMLIAHKLNLTGPSVSINTACSTSLVTVHMACQALLNGECDIAAAGGVSITLPVKTGYLHEEGMILSPDGHCRAFDQNGGGSVPGNGAAVVVLKRYDEAVEAGDHIYAVIKSSAINNDGSRKSGFTAPGVEGQAEVIRTALQLAEVEADAIHFVEAHGTGTLLGDPIELEALKTAFVTDRTGYCRIGSLKSNLGHLDVAAGAAGLIKAILSLKHRLLPPTLHFHELNSKINLDHSPFTINAGLHDYSQERETLRAGVSSFGIGGTNAHLVLEEPAASHRSAKGNGMQIVPFSAKTETALDRSCELLATHLQAHPDLHLHDLAYTLQVGRTPMEHRRFVVASSLEELSDTLGSIQGDSGKRSRKIYTNTVEHMDKPIVFMFPGLGSQYVNMGLGLYLTEPMFQQEMDRCFAVTDAHLDTSIKEIIYPLAENTEEAEQLIKRMDWSQLVVFIFEYALGHFLMGLGIKPRYMIGYSFGEYAAACMSGVFSLEDAIRLIIQRGRLIRSTQPGAMVSVPLTEQELKPLLPDDISVCIVNGPSCIVGGTAESVLCFEEHMKSLRQICIRLDTGYALHSSLMEPIRQAFQDEFAGVTLSPPRVPFISNLTGGWILAEEATDPAYWARQLTDTIRFADGIGEIVKHPALTFIEAGPDRNLSALLRYAVHRDSPHTLVNMIRNPQEKMDDSRYFLTRLGQLWTAGHTVEWSALHSGEKRFRLSLPTYPFERQTYPLDGNPYQRLQHAEKPKSSSLVKKGNMEDWFYVPLWKQEMRISADLSQKARTWLVFANRDRLSQQLILQLKATGGQVVAIYPGEAYEQILEDEFTLNPGSGNDYRTLLKELQHAQVLPDTILHLWSMDHGEAGPTDPIVFAQAQQNGFYSVMHLVQALRVYTSNHSTRIGIISRGMAAVTGGEVLFPENSMLTGMGLVVSQEIPHVHCLMLDTDWHVGLSEGADCRLAALLIQEIEGQGPASEPRVAYRHGQRWVPIYQPVKLTGLPEPQDVFRKKGVYVITGGAGLIGWMIGEMLARDYQAVVAIIQRSFPVKAQWEHWLATHDTEDPVSVKIREMQKVERTGGRIHILQADITDEQQLATAVKTIEIEYGLIHGVFHCAAQLGEDTHFNPIQQLGKEQCEAIFAPKVDGVLVLDRIFGSKKLDFCLLMSSTAAELGGFGFAAYAAANLFMDLYLRKRNQNAVTMWKTVNWEAWRKECDTPGEFQTSIRDLAMTPAEGIEAVRRVLAAETLTHLIHSPGDLELRLDEWVRFKTMPLSHIQEPRILRNKHNIRKHMVEYEKPEKPLEQQLARIWEDFLGVEGIGTQDNFFELGATSLTLIRMKSLLEEELNLDIPIVDLFAYPTISSLAKYLNANEDDTHEAAEEKRLQELESGRDHLTRQFKLRKSEAEYD